MRVEYLHRGGPGGERVTLDRVVADGAWAGSRSRLIDDTNLGAYFIEVSSLTDDRPIYSRGFGSVYGEWVTTPEAVRQDRVFHETVRVPWPQAPVRVTIKKRDAANIFRDLWATDIDPESTGEFPVAGRSTGTVRRLLDQGPPDTKIDLLLVSEGYSAGQMRRFHHDAAHLIGVLFGYEPFKSRKNDFNVRALELPGRRLGVERNIFGIERYLLAADDRALRNAAALVPYDIVAILIDDDRYGGGGIFNLQSAVAARARGADYVFVHELAHNLAAIADEYVGNVTYRTGSPVRVEPWEPNLTALLDPTRLKWADLIQPGTPLPTPLTYAGRVGAFEGAGYEAKGLYRPEADCLMFSRNPVGFCRVCQRAINRIIELYTR
jgi:IgA peptidase M64/peptidase M64-like protein